LTVGWRWAFLGMAALALVTLLAVPPDAARSATATREPRRALGRRANQALAVIGVASALGAGAANALAAFLVDSTVARGISPGLAGLTLTIGSVVCVTSRLLLGWLADRRTTGHLAIVAALYGVGGLGFILLGLPSTAALVVGVTLGFGLGWAWPGVVNFAVVKRHPEAPAAATSVTQTGVYAGACIGPLVLGLVAAHAGYATMWPIAGAMLLLACLLVTRALKGG
jgi:predicted MFS family arabinose efflux permease